VTGEDLLEKPAFVYRYEKDVLKKNQTQSKLTLPVELNNIIKRSFTTED
jgi:hypothetical protein